MSERAKRKGRLAIYSMAGFYLLYTAWQIYTDAIPNSEGKENTILWIAFVCFIVIGAGGIIWSMRETYLLQKEDHEAREKAEKEQKKKQVKTLQERARLPETEEAGADGASVPEELEENEELPAAEGLPEKDGPSEKE